MDHRQWVEDHRDDLRQQSEMLQGTIGRMANNSLAVKQVGLTVWSAIVGFGFTNKNAALFGLAFVTFALFGVLDIYYLYLERKFRDNFNRLVRILGGFWREGDEAWLESKQGNFLKPDMTTKFLGQVPSVLKSWANLPYLVTLVITAVLLQVPL